MKKSLHIDANNINGKYSVSIVGEGFDAEDLEKLFDHIQILSENDSDYLITYPVIRELEDPIFMEEMDRRIEEIKNGTVKAIPLETVMKELKEKKIDWIEELDCDDEDDE